MSDLFLAMSHPLRRQILRRMRDVDVSSPRQLSRELERSTSDVAYHVRMLADCGALTLVRVEPVRGVVRHVYRNSLTAPWAKQIINLERPCRGNVATEK